MANYDSLRLDDLLDINGEICRVAGFIEGRAVILQTIADPQQERVYGEHGEIFRVAKRLVHEEST